MSTTPVQSSATSSSGSRIQNGRIERRSSPAPRDGRHHRKQRAQRATWACERCRFKKLRCTGGDPCSACRRAEVECDLGDGGPASQKNDSLMSERLQQLEKTVVDLVAGLGHLTQSQPTPVSMQTSAPLSSPFFPPAMARTFPVISADVTRTGHSDYTREQATAMSDVGNSPSLVFQNKLVNVPTFAARSDINSLACSQRYSVTPDSARAPSVTSPSSPEAISSRWAALQHNSAPFPQLMGHPTAWSGGAAGTSPGADQAAQPAVGLTHYRANVHLQSEPIKECIVQEVVAKALYTLFFKKCHPLFPLLDPCIECHSHFHHVRSSSPFLFTAILAIAARYHAVYEATTPTPDLPPIPVSALEALADLACAHLGFSLFRKQHQLSDVQATLLLSAWIPRGNGRSADQWMTTGLCMRMAYRIGIPDICHLPVIERALESSHLDAQDIQDLNQILPQWHTWLTILQYNTSLSLGFGRPHEISPAVMAPRQFLKIVRRLGESAPVNLVTATYVTSLAELSDLATDFITGLSNSRLRSSSSEQNTTQSTMSTFVEILSLLSNLNPRLDEWQRQWTWSGSFDTIALESYTALAKIYGEHTRLCINSLSLNLIMAQAGVDVQQKHEITSCLSKACEAAVALVRCYVGNSIEEPVVRYGGEYLVLILGQAAIFFVRVLVARVEEPLPIDQAVLAHYLKKAIELLESNDFSSTRICSWLGRLCRDLASHAGVVFDTERATKDANLDELMPNLSELDWDFDISAILGQDIPAGETGLDLGHHFDFTAF